MKKNIILRSALCLTLAASMLTMGACKSKDTTDDTTAASGDEQTAPVYYTDTPGSVKKSETVYVNMSNSGEVKDITVTDWLHTDKGQVKVSDTSSLKNITNVKSDIKPVIEDDGLTWHMDTTDLYYSGKSNKTLPVNIKIDYSLDGKSISAEKLAGKSGKVEIKITVENNLYKTEKVNGKNVKIYNPIAVVGGMVLPEGQFENMSLANGKLVGDGTKQIALIVSLPGMNETLGLDELEIEKLDFVTEFVLTADVTDFSLGNMYFAAVPLSMLGTELKIPNSLNDLQTTLAQLKDLESALNSMDPNNVVANLLTDQAKLDELVSTMNDAITLYQDNRVLFEVLPKYATAENVEKFKKLFDSLDSEELKEVVTLLNNPVLQKFFKDLPELAQNMNDVMPLIEEFSKDMSDPNVQKAINNLPQTLEQLSAIEKTVEENKELIDALAELMSEDNVEKLNKLLDTVNSGDYAGKLQEYGVLAEDADEMIDKLQLMISYGATYDIYTEKTAGTESNVMFVYQTSPISAKEVEEETTQTTEELPWYKKIFNR
ncbi:MAG: hypothetical protein ACI4I0_02090 [Acutalibacteraceae bacterium]